MYTKVIGGTPSSGKRLCDTCKESVITRGASADQEVVWCRETQKTIGIQVVDCNRYKQDGRPSLYDMRQIAWVLEIDSKRSRMGFLNAAEWRERKQDEEVVPNYLLD